MSFAGTPLGQGRRLDHNTFLGKPPSNGNRPSSPQRIAPTSYAYGAPTLGSRSPPRPKPSSRELTTSATDHSNDDNALSRYAKLKQQQSGSNSSLNPEKWSVRDTTVNVASAIHQAASVSEMQSHNPNSAWASGSRPTTHVPRSTSVEYETQSQTTSNRRLNVPPSRLGNPRSKPLSKASNSMKSVVPDSEAEESQDINGRAKSPFDQVVDMAKIALEKTSYYVLERDRPREPENGSYDYSAEEREYQRSASNLSANGSKRINPTHRKNRMSTDNKAYKPSKDSEEEEDDDEVSDDGRRRRRKKKKDGPMGGPLTSLPVVGQDKRRKKRAKGSKGNVGGVEEEESESEDAQERSAPERASASRNSAPPSRQPSRHGSVQPGPFGDSSATLAGLDDIPEDIEVQSPDESYSFEDNSSSSVIPSRNGIGGWLGTLVFSFFSICMTVCSAFFLVIGKALGLVIDTLLLRPCRWIAKINSQSITVGFRYLIIALTVVSVGWVFQEPLRGMAPPWSPSGPKYTAPDIPVENIAELNARLRAIEAALSGLALENEQSRIRTENGERSRVELLGRLGALEGTVKKESGRMKDVEKAVGEREEKERVIRNEMKLLKELVNVLQQQPPNSVPGEAVSSDEEARARLKALEERVGTVEGGVKDALDMGKNAFKAGEVPAWWNKVLTGKKGLTIKSSDGQDVSSLISHLVEDAISVYGKDTVGRPDFALHSSGARVVPSLTSNTFEMRPPNFRSQVLGMLTGSGYYIGLPPVHALHHELHNGECWPFAGSEGQLGVALAAPIYVDHITIDHVAKEVAFDMRSAPRQMEVWGMVEGRDNIAKVKEYMKEKERMNEEARARGEDVPEEEYPRTLPKNPMYIRIASFTYNIHAPKNIQTFPVLPEIAALGVDFGIVVLRVRSNWGRDEFTCLYRMRVHGQRMGEIPLPYPEEMANA